MTHTLYTRLSSRRSRNPVISRYALYLHDYGSQIGLRLAMKAPERVTALIIQNGDIYEDELGPKYKALQDYWANPTPKGREKLSEAVSEAGFRDEFINEVPDCLIDQISPDLWKLSWSLMEQPQRREIMIGLMAGLRANLDWFPKYQTYLREHQPPTLIVWGPERYAAIDVASAFGKILQKPVKAVETPRDQWIKTLQAMGFSNEAAVSFSNMTSLTIEGEIPAGHRVTRGVISLERYIETTIV